MSLQVATYRGRREGTKQRRGSGCTSQRGKGCTTRHRHPSRGQAGRGEQRRRLHERASEAVSTRRGIRKEGRIDWLWCVRTAVGVVAGGSGDARSLAGALSIGAVGALGARRQAKVTASSACGAPERKSSRAHGSNNTESRARRLNLRCTATRIRRLSPYALLSLRAPVRAGTQPPTATQDAERTPPPPPAAPPPFTYQHRKERTRSSRTPTSTSPGSTGSKESCRSTRTGQEGIGPTGREPQRRARGERSPSTWW